MSDEPSMDGAGGRMHALMERLFPLCRSITGDGVRQTLDEIARRLPLDVYEVPTGTDVLDWTVPDEWNIRDAYIADGSGARLVDFRDSNLHVLGYSEPVRRTMSLAELRAHLHTDREHPDRIPYRTSYYTRTWGFCLSQAQLDSLGDGDYEVVIDSTLAAGSLTYGECALPGESDDEILLTTHVCHPSLANDNLSGVSLLTELGAFLASAPRKVSYRLLFIPGTIGSITWLARNDDRLSRIVAGLVLACVGDQAPLTYKRTRRGDASIDRAAAHVLSQVDAGSRVVDFVPWGWDERQFNTLGVDLPVGCLCRSREGEFDEYHSSADHLGLVRADRLEEALRAVVAMLHVLETDRRFVNLSPKGEPQLGKRGLYRTTGGGGPSDDELAVLWILSQSDGTCSLLDVAERAGLAFDVVRRAADRLLDAGLLADVAGR